ARKMHARGQRSASGVIRDQRAVTQLRDAGFIVEHELVLLEPRLEIAAERERESQLAPALGSLFEGKALLQPERAVEEPLGEVRSVAVEHARAVDFRLGGARG